MKKPYTLHSTLSRDPESIELFSYDESDNNDDNNDNNNEWGTRKKRKGPAQILFAKSVTFNGKTDIANFCLSLSLYVGRVNEWVSNATRQTLELLNFLSLPNHTTIQIAALMSLPKMWLYKYALVTDENDQKWHCCKHKHAVVDIKMLWHCWRHVQTYVNCDGNKFTKRCSDLTKVQQIILCIYY